MRIRSEVRKLSVSDIAKMTATLSKNRPVSPRYVTKLAGVMKRGEWLVNGEAVIVNDKGQVIDGQHRLLAALEADLPLETLIVEGVSGDVFGSIDQGRPRSFAQLLGMEQEEHAVLLGATLRVIAAWEVEWQTLSRGNQTGQLTRDSLSAAQGFGLLHRHPTVRDSVALLSTLGVRSPFRNVAGLSVFSFVHYAASVTSGQPRKADGFIMSVFNGEGLEAGDPRLTVRNKLLSLRADGQSPRGMVNRSHLISLLIRAWNGYVKGEAMHSLRFTDVSEMPTFRGEAAYFAKLGRPAEYVEQPEQSGEAA